MNNLLVTDYAIIKKEKIESIYAVDAYCIYIGNGGPEYDIYAKTNDGPIMLYSKISQSFLPTVMNNLASKLLS